MISNLEIYYRLFNKTYVNIIDTYLNSCKYYGVMSNYFSQYLSEGNAKNPEEGKKIAIYMFVKYINKFKQKSNIEDISIGFSDDDKGNIDKIEKFFKNQLSIEFSQMKFNIYDTSNRDNTIHTKINY